MVSAFHMTNYEEGNVLYEVWLWLFEYAVFKNCKEWFNKVSISGTSRRLKLVEVLKSVTKIIQKTIQKQVNFDFLFGIKPQRSFLYEFFFSLHFMIWVLRWKSGAFATANFDLCVQHCNLIDYFSKEFLFKFKDLLQRLLSLSLLFECTTDTCSADWCQTLRLKIFSRLSQEFFANRIGKLLIN